jgi:hypothetical protein
MGFLSTWSNQLHPDIDIIFTFSNPAARWGAVKYLATACDLFSRDIHFGNHLCVRCRKEPGPTKIFLVRNSMDLLRHIVCICYSRRVDNWLLPHSGNGPIFNCRDIG